jgi:hypothetical protein
MSHLRTTNNLIEPGGTRPLASGDKQRKRVTAFVRLTDTLKRLDLTDTEQLQKAVDVRWISKQVISKDLNHSPPTHKRCEKEKHKATLGTLAAPPLDTAVGVPNKRPIAARKDVEPNRIACKRASDYKL